MLQVFYLAVVLRGPAIAFAHGKACLTPTLHVASCPVLIQGEICIQSLSLVQRSRCLCVFFLSVMDIDYKWLILILGFLCTVYTTIVSWRHFLQQKLVRAQSGASTQHVRNVESVNVPHARARTVSGWCEGCGFLNSCTALKT